MAKQKPETKKPDMMHGTPQNRSKVDLDTVKKEFAEHEKKLEEKKKEREKKKLKKKTKPSSKKKLKELEKARKVMKTADKDSRKIQIAWSKFLSRNQEWANVDIAATRFHDLIVDYIFGGRDGNMDLLLSLSHPELVQLTNTIGDIGEMIMFRCLSAAKKAKKAYVKYVEHDTDVYLREIGKTKREYRDFQKRQRMGNGLVPKDAFHDFNFGCSIDALSSLTFSNMTEEQLKHWLMHGYNCGAVPAKESEEKRNHLPERVIRTISEYLTQLSYQDCNHLIGVLGREQKMHAIGFMLSTLHVSDVQEIFDNLVTDEAATRLLHAFSESKYGKLIDAKVDIKARTMAQQLTESKGEWSTYESLPFVDDPNDTEVRVFSGLLMLKNALIRSLMIKTVVTTLETVGDKYGLRKYLDADKFITDSYDNLTAIFGNIEDHEQHERQIYLISGEGASVLMGGTKQVRTIPDAIASTIAEYLTNYLVNAMGDDYPDELKTTQITTYAASVISEIPDMNDHIKGALLLYTSVNFSF